MSNLWVALALGLAMGVAAQADGGGRRMPAPVPPADLDECVGCHVAYPPGLLPTVSWQRAMDGLDLHDGADASLDHETVKQLSAWLQAHAATCQRARAEPPPSEDRITRSRWFARKHEDIAPHVYRRPVTRSAANCAVCHGGAQRGEFDGGLARIPK